METVSEFNDKFDKIHSQISKGLCLSEAIVHLLYVNSFEGNFVFIPRDKNSTTLAQSKEHSAKIKDNILSSMIDII